MPIYDFVCRACGKDFELLVMGSSTPECPFCQSEKLQKKMSTFAFRSSGGGSSNSQSGSSPGCSGCSGGDCSSCH